MYRFLIEHPRWIPANRLAQLDVRAGADRGRVYRLRPSAVPLSGVKDLTKLGAAELAGALDSANGTERDRVHVELLARADASAAPALEQLARGAKLPQVRLQALCALEGMRALKPGVVKSAFADPDSRVREHAIRLCETRFDSLGDALLALADDPSPLVRHQLAFTLGEWDDPRAGAALGPLAAGGLDDPEMRTAVLSSSARHCGAVLAAVTAAPGRGQWLPALVATAAASKDAALVRQALTAVLPHDGASPAADDFAAVAGLVDVLERHGELPTDEGVSAAFAAARRAAADGDAPAASRAAAVRLLGRTKPPAEDVALLCRLAAREPAVEVRTAAVDALRKQTSAGVAARLLSDWRRASPAARPQLVALLLGRDEWAAALLDAVKRGVVQANEVSLADRSRLAGSDDAHVRSLAAEVFPANAAGARADVDAVRDALTSLVREGCGCSY
jgi:hypothetical protein